MSLTKMIKTVAKKNTGRDVSSIDLSLYADKKSLVTLSTPAMNLAHSGRFDTGPSWGSHQIVGESKTFKTLFLAIQVAEFLNNDKKAICVFTDAEGGANLHYWESVGAPMDRIIHIPVTSVEENSSVIMNILDQYDVEGDENLIFATDSIGQLGSRKELENTIGDEANKQDFTRAKSLNSFWRLVIPNLNVNRIPYFWIGGMYATTDQYKPNALSGGKKGELGSDSIWMITKSQQKESVKNEETGKKKDEKTGWNFNIRVDKGRFCIEGTVIPITVRYKGGVDRWSFVLEAAREVGAVAMVSNGWYQRTEKVGFVDDKKVQKVGMDDQWYEELMMSDEFHDLIEKRYRVSAETLLKHAENNVG